MASMLRNYLRWRVDRHAIRHIDPYVRASIEPLEKVLELETEASGNDITLIAQTILNLANAYRVCGQDEKAIALYKRLTDTHWGMYDDQLEYADLLVKSGRRAEARKYMEEEAADGSGQYDSGNPLTVRLMKAYADDKMKQQLRDMVLQVTRYAEPDRIATTDYFSYPMASYANRPYSRNGVIYRK